MRSSTGRPYRDWLRRPAIHQVAVKTVSEPTRSAVPTARRQSISRPHTAKGNHSAAARPAYRNELALVPPTVAATRANSAGWRHPPPRAASITSPTSHGMPAQGSRIAVVRPR